HLLNNLPNKGDRVRISHVFAQDLAAMSRHTGDEFAVVLNRHGDLCLVRGGPEFTTIKQHDVMVLHTHPHTPEGFAAGTSGPNPEGNYYRPYPDDIGYDPGGNHRGDVAIENRPHRSGPEHQKPKAIVYEDGSARYYDRNGPLGAN